MYRAEVPRIGLMISENFDKNSAVLCMKLVLIYTVAWLIPL